MEVAAGAFLVLVGLYFLPLPRLKKRQTREGGGGLRLPLWADTALNALISLLCVVFGIALLFGQGRYLTF
jgi:hypothetical protein